jgi:LacI family transcriptional regulator, repressor for deo operon, udp, cdd, tsx, nupC, and nupG
MEGVNGMEGFDGERRVRIEDVAAAADVSVATVSRALRHMPNVAESTRQRVIAIAESMHYRPDPAAARLAAGSSRTVTVVVPHLSSWYFSMVIAGAEAVCAEQGYECLVTGIPTLDHCDRLLAPAAQLERRTDGVILVNIPVSPAQASSLRARRVRVATIGTRTPGCPSVSIDDERTAALATGHLVELGHRRIGLISGQSQDPMNFVVPQDRRRGYEQVHRDAGIGIDHTLIVGGNFGITGGQEAMAELLRHRQPPTAVVAMSDEMAFGALLELSERGLRAGTDVSVVGIDDHDVARVLRLTTVRQRVADQGAAAARALIDTLQSPDAAVVDVDSPIELVVRATTGPPAT